MDKDEPGILKIFGKKCRVAIFVNSFVMCFHDVH